MRTLIKALLILGFSVTAWADNPPLVVTEQDGSPSGVATKIKFPNGTVSKSATVFTISASTALAAGSTNYIQNSLTPTTTTQAFSVQYANVTGTMSVSGLGINSSGGIDTINGYTARIQGNSGGYVFFPDQILLNSGIRGGSATATIDSGGSTNPFIFQPLGTNNVVPLVVRNKSGQTLNAQEWQGSGSFPNAYVDKDGVFVSENYFQAWIPADGRYGQYGPSAVSFYNPSGFASVPRRYIFGYDGNDDSFNLLIGAGQGVFQMGQRGNVCFTAGKEANAVFNATVDTNTGVQFAFRGGDADSSAPLATALFRTLTRATPLAGFGGYFGMKLHDDTNTEQLASQILTTWRVPTSASRKARVEITVADTSTRTAVQFDTDGSNAYSTFFGSATFTGPLISTSVFYTTTSSRPWVSSCGTSPSIASYSTNQSGLITVGSGITSSCTLNFGTPIWINPPACIFTSNAAIASGTGSTTASAFIFGGTSITSDVVMYQCAGSY